MNKKSDGLTNRILLNCLLLIRRNRHHRQVDWYEYHQRRLHYSRQIGHHHQSLTTFGGRVKCDEAFVSQCSENTWTVTVRVFPTKSIVDFPLCGRIVKLNDSLHNLGAWGIGFRFAECIPRPMNAVASFTAPTLFNAASASFISIFSWLL